MMSARVRPKARFRRRCPGGTLFGDDSSRAPPGRWWNQTAEDWSRRYLLFTREKLCEELGAAEEGNELWDSVETVFYWNLRDSYAAERSWSSGERHWQDVLWEADGMRHMSRQHWSLWQKVPDPDEA